MSPRWSSSTSRFHLAAQRSVSDDRQLGVRIGFEESKGRIECDPRAFPVFQLSGIDYSQNLVALELLFGPSQRRQVCDTCLDKRTHLRTVAPRQGLGRVAQDRVRPRGGEPGERIEGP